MCGSGPWRSSAESTQPRWNLGVGGGREARGVPLLGKANLDPLALRSRGHLGA